LIFQSFELLTLKLLGSSFCFLCSFFKFPVYCLVLATVWMELELLSIILTLPCIFSQITLEPWDVNYIPLEACACMYVCVCSVCVLSDRQYDWLIPVQGYLSHVYKQPYKPRKWTTVYLKSVQYCAVL
jgi:hypothetical protein